MELFGFFIWLLKHDFFVDRIPRRWYCDVLLLNVILIGNISRFNCYIKKVAFTYELVIFMYDSNPDNAKLLIHCNEPSIKN